MNFFLSIKMTFPIDETQQSTGPSILDIWVGVEQNRCQEICVCTLEQAPVQVQE